MDGGFKHGAEQLAAIHHHHPSPSVLHPHTVSRSSRSRLDHHLPSPLNHGFGDGREVMPAPRPPTAKNVTGRNGCRHTKRSPSERRFKCEQHGCEKVFFTRKDVKRHMVVHTGQRNFACPFCQQRFGRKDHLVRHAKKSHNRDTRVSTAAAFSALAQGPSQPSSSSHPFSQPKNHGSPFRPSVASSVVGQMSPLHHGNGTSILPMSSVLGSSPSPMAGHNGHSVVCCPPGQAPSSEPSSSLLLLGSSHGNPNGNGAFHHSSNHHHSVQSVSEGHNFSSPTSALVSHHHHSQHSSVGDSLVHSLTSAGHVTSSQVAQGIHTSSSKSPSDGTAPPPPTASYFSFPVPSATSFVSHHSLMPNPFVANSARSLYSSTGPGAFSVSVHGMSSNAAAAGHLSAVVGGDPHHHPHHHAAAAAAAAHAASMGFAVENPQLPHFSQAFQ